MAISPGPQPLSSLTIAQIRMRIDDRVRWAKRNVQEILELSDELAGRLP